MISAEIDTGFARIKLETNTIGILRVTITRADPPTQLIFNLTSPEAEFLANSLRMLAKGAP